MNATDLKALVGQPLGGVTGWRQVDQDLIDRFADLTGDRHWIHLDAERARRETEYDGTIAHGYLTLVTVPQFVNELIDIDELARVAINYGLNKVRFPTPVPAGGRLRGRCIVKSVDDVPGGIQPTIEVTVELEGSQKPACVAELVFRFLD